MKKLWEKQTKLNTIIETFETKDDILLDQKLIPYDLEGSLAHAKMLQKIEILSDEELELLKKGLKKISELYEKGEFVLSSGDEDMHTKIENYLTDNFGNVGKKIHTGRSRNDQVLTALRLFSKSKLENIAQELHLLIQTLETFWITYGHVSMPGYTHMQKAMPSSLGLWIGSLVDAFEDDMNQVLSVYEIIDQSPLGSAAGYGLPIEIDREYTAMLLRFSKVQKNSLYCQLSRGKFESAIVGALVQVLLTINKFASDVLLFTTQEFSFFTVSESVTTGSSIMPQKKNMDIAELLRSKVSVVLGNYTQIVSISSNLISGYNRDMQDTKKPFMESLDITFDSIQVMRILVENIKPNKEVLSNSLTDDLFATEKALKLVLKGENFRDAYRKVKNDLEGGDTI